MCSGLSERACSSRHVLLLDHRDPSAYTAENHTPWSPDVKGPLSAFGYDYFSDHYDGPPVGLFQYRGLRGTGGTYAYEVLNMVDGARRAQDIRDLVSAEFGPVPLELVVEYLQALESIGVVGR